MEITKEILKQANIIPKLRLGTKTDKGVVSTGPHRVKFLQDKEIKAADYMGKEVEMIAYLVEENGEKKSYRVKKLNPQGDISYLVIRLGEVQEGEEVILEMKKKGMKNYIEVTSLKNSSTLEADDDEIPIINDGDDGIPIINADDEIKS